MICGSYLTEREVLDAHAQFGKVNWYWVKAAMGPNWPVHWEALGPGEAIFGPPALAVDVNGPRAVRAAEAIKVYEDKFPGVHADDVVTTLLADLMIYCDAIGCNFDQQLKDAQERVPQ